MDINERKKIILKSIIDTYISSGEPVGSKYITEHIGFSVSPATVRNDMNDLENMGLLEQPHTSSGRIPSSSGYRMYVDSLMNRYRLTMEEINVIDELLNAKLTEINSIIEEATRLFSDRTKYASVAITSKPKNGMVKKFEGIIIDPHSILIVMITSMNMTKSRQIETDSEIDANKLASILHVLNEHLAGIQLADINVSLIMRIEQQLGSYRDVFSPILRAVYEVVSEIDRYHVYLNGLSNLLSYPEFADVVKAREMLAMLEHKSQLISMLSQAKTNDMNVYIGDDSLPGYMNDTSIIFHTFELHGGMIGAVGFIGPRRMDYSKVIAQLEYFTQNLISAEDYGMQKNHEKGYNNGGE